MLITRVELQNIKSYADQSITFTQGTNAICGQNGAGKSTLLEAIGFTLFDYLPYTQADFVRAGEKTATITVGLVSSKDGREYQVVRRCGASSDYYVYDPEIGARLVGSKADVLDWLREHLEVESATDLAALFRDAIGVPQGLLTAPFLQTPSQRKSVFDPLLRVDEYDRAWNSLRDTSRYLKDQMVESEKAIAGLGPQVERLPERKEKVQKLKTDITDTESKLADLETDLQQSVADRQTLEGIEQNLKELAGRVSNLTTRLQGIGEQLHKGQQSVAEAEMAHEAVESNRLGHEAYEAAQSTLASLEGDREQRDRLQAELASQEKSLALAQARLEGLEANLTEIEDAQAQIEALNPQVERQANCEASLEEAQERVRVLESFRSQAAERQMRLDDLEARLQALEAELSQAQQIEDELGQTRAQLEETRQALGDLKSERAGLEAEMRRLVEQTQSLQAAETAQCPVCEQPLTAEHRSDLLTRNETQLGELQSSNRALESEIAQTAERQSALEQGVTRFESQLRNLPRAADRDDLAAQIADLDGALTVLRAEIEKLADSPHQVSRLQRELAELEDPRRQVEHLTEKVKQRAEIENRLEAERHAITALQASLVEVEGGLAPFADLDERLAEQRALRDQHQTDHELYLKNIEIAADLSERRQEVESLQAQQAEFIAKRDEAQAEADEVSAGFDPQALEEARGREAGLKADQARLEGQLDRLRQELSEVESEVEKLEAAEQQLAAEQQSLSDYQALRDLTEFIRQVLRDAGPHVTRRLVQQVALDASRLFADVMSDHTARLRWQDDYGIVLEKDGRDRDYQQLSGGEQMAAALAVRLALLRELSSIDVAFFDEPTSNLDGVRRDSLAEQILSVKGFAQLFVISHDDTFERVTNNVVRVRKEDGISMVVVE